MESNEGKIKSKYQSEQKMYVNDKESEGISTFLSVLAWMIFIGGFIGGIIVANREREIEGWYYDEVEKYFDWSVAITVWLSCLISDVVLLGFAKVINILSMILSPNKLIYTSMSYMECYMYRAEELFRRLKEDTDTITCKIEMLENNVDKKNDAGITEN